MKQPDHSHDVSQDAPVGEGSDTLPESGSTCQAGDAMSQPSPNGDNGERDSRGRFAKGNRGGPGNPYAKRVSDYRRAFLSTVTPDGFVEIVKVLVERARAGDVAAARVILDRLLGQERVTEGESLAEATAHVWE